MLNTIQIYLCLSAVLHRDQGKVPQDLFFPCTTLTNIPRISPAYSPSTAEIIIVSGDSDSNKASMPKPHDVIRAHLKCIPSEYFITVDSWEPLIKTHDNPLIVHAFLFLKTLPGFSSFDGVDIRSAACLWALNVQTPHCFA